MKLCHHDFTIVIVQKFLVHGHCSESGLHSRPSRSSRCPRCTVVASITQFVAYLQITGGLRYTTQQKIKTKNKKLCILMSIEISNRLNKSNLSINRALIYKETIIKKCSIFINYQIYFTVVCILVRIQPYQRF